jgi:hypothetical protein
MIKRTKQEQKRKQWTQLKDKTGLEQEREISNKIFHDLF